MHVSPVVTIFGFIFIVIPIVVFISYWVFTSLSKADSGLKFMVLGLHISIVGGIVVVDSKIDLLGFEYVVILLGLILSFLGVRKMN